MDIIAALATPPGAGAISVIRLSGAGSWELAEQILRKFNASKATARKLLLDEVVKQNGETIDEILVSIFRNPQSYTGEDVVELSGHGGLLITKRVLERCLQAGARLAEPGEFTQRAFENGKMDLTQAEGVMDLIQAQTDLAHKAALTQLKGGLGHELENIRAEYIASLAHLEAYIDFPEEGISPESGNALVERIHAIKSQLQQLLHTEKRGRFLREGARIAIVGSPNVGKSSLLNALLGYGRAIVSNEAGTTRDTIEEAIELAGVKVRFIDTAGLREDGGHIEQEGMRRTRMQLEQADLILEVIDSSLPPQKDRINQDSVLILNKCDLETDPNWAKTDAIRMSCKTKQGMQELETLLTDKINQGLDWTGGHFLAINLRHRKILLESIEALDEALSLLKINESPEIIALPMREGLQTLGKIAGAVDSEEILGHIFSNFCIGK